MTATAPIVTKMSPAISIGTRLLPCESRPLAASPEKTTGARLLPLSDPIAVSCQTGIIYTTLKAKEYATKDRPVRKKSRPEQERHTGRREEETVAEEGGAQTRIRTTDTRIFNPLLYQLSYLGTLGEEAFGHSFPPEVLVFPREARGL